MISIGSILAERVPFGGSVAFLASPAASLMTGSIVSVDAGFGA